MRTTLQNGEEVALIVKKHWFVLAKPAIIFLVVLSFAMVRHSKLYGFQNLLNVFFPYALAASAAFLLYNWLDRRTNIWVVTNRRLIDESGIVSRKSRKTPSRRSTTS